MSGGHYNYEYGRIRDLADRIFEDVERYSRDSIDKYGFAYAAEKPEILDAMGLCAETLKLASQMAYDVEWYMSGDTGEDTFLKAVKNWNIKSED